MLWLSQLMQTPNHDSAAIYRYRDCLAAVDCLCAAIVHLDFFTWLSQNPTTPRDLCERLHLHPRPTDAMLTLFLANGFLRRTAGGTLHLSSLAEEFLVAGSLCDTRAYYASIADKPGVHDFLKVLRTGKPANWPGEKGEADWHAAMRSPAFAEAFTAAMDCRGRVLAPALAEAVPLASSKKMLDIGGGSGVYTIACLEANPHLRGIVLESSPVDAIARRTIQQAEVQTIQPSSHAKARLADRISVLTGDMFTDAWPSDCDVHLFSNVLHDWDEPDCRRLLSQSAQSLSGSGRIVIHDMFLNDDKTGPLWAAEYSVLLAGVTQGRLYSTNEISGWLQPLGFVIVQHTPTALGRSVLEAVRQA